MVRTGGAERRVRVPDPWRTAWPALPLLVLLAWLLGASAAVAAGRHPMTVAEGIAVPRLLNLPQPAVLSPDGSRYFVLVAHGDLQANVQRLDIFVGGTASLDDAVPRRVAQLSCRCLQDFRWPGRLPALHPSLADFRWLPDGRRIAFLWAVDDKPTQVMTVDAGTGKLSALTRHPTSVISFEVSRDGAQILYWAYPAGGKPDLEDVVSTGFAVGSPDALSLLHGYTTADSPWSKVDVFLASTNQGDARRIELDRRPTIAWSRLRKFSPDGRFIIADGTPADIPAAWDAYGGDGYTVRARLPEARRNPDVPSGVNQLFVVDTASARVRPLWDALFDRSARTDLAWSPDGTRVAVGPTFLPPDTTVEAGLHGEAFAVVDVETGAYEVLPGTEGLRLIAWRKGGAIVLGNDTQTWRYMQTSGRWTKEGQPHSLPPDSAAPVVIKVRQDLNTPPVLHAVDRRSGQSHPVLDPTPGLLERFELGEVRMIDWRAADGRSWRGRLYYPVGYRPGTRHPLVIQTNGHAPDGAFSLLGAENLTTAYAAQVLAGRGFVVVQMANAGERGLDGTPEEAPAYLRALEAIVDKLDAQGLVDAARVGLSGFSRTGWIVEYAITHSQRRWGAAAVADNIDGNYLQAMLDPKLSAGFALTNGGEPFGDGLQAWRRASPAFNVEAITTPLRLEVDTCGVQCALSHWEMFSRLRMLGKPVELYVVPDAQHASHPLQIPAQQRASREGAVDWFDFWLNAHEDPAPHKQEQYRRWRAFSRERSVVAPEGSGKAN